MLYHRVLNEGRASQVSVGKESGCNEGATGDMGSIPGWEHPLEEEMSTHSRILA